MTCGLMGVVQKGSEAWVWVCMTGTGLKERELVSMVCVCISSCSRYWEVNVCVNVKTECDGM